MISMKQRVIIRVKKNTLGDELQTKVTQQTRMQKCWVTSDKTCELTPTPHHRTCRVTAGELLHKLQFFCMGDRLDTVVNV